MNKRRTVKRTRTRIPDYTCLGCTVTKSRTQWCFHLCVPNDGIGTCGRVAPHSLTSRTQKAILAHRIRKAQSTTP